jgi:hypothetical protein
MSKLKNTKNTLKRPYWYATDVYCCVLCGTEKKYKGRVYIESEKGTRFYNDLCWEHKL